MPTVPLRSTSPVQSDGVPMPAMVQRLPPPLTSPPTRSTRPSPYVATDRGALVKPVRLIEAPQGPVQRIRARGDEDQPLAVEGLTTPRSPWQNGYAERLIGSIRRECLDHLIVLSERHLLRILGEYFEYYHRSRPHHSLDGNSPEPRETQIPERGRLVSPCLRAAPHVQTRGLSTDPRPIAACL